MMTNNLMMKAKELATQPYIIVIEHSQTTTGEPMIAAYHPELPACIAQGETITEALAELAEMSEEYILSLLEDDLPIPAPRQSFMITR